MVAPLGCVFSQLLFRIEDQANEDIAQQVAGAFVFSAGLGLVATNCINAFSYGYDRLRFIKPVFIGDTIYTIRTNLDKRPRYAELGIIRASYEVFKNEGELVLYCEHIQTVKYKNPADFVGKTEK